MCLVSVDMRQQFTDYSSAYELKVEIDSSPYTASLSDILTGHLSGLGIPDWSSGIRW